MRKLSLGRYMGFEKVRNTNNNLLYIGNRVLHDLSIFMIKKKLCYTLYTAYKNKNLNDWDDKKLSYNTIQYNTRKKY